MYVCQKFISIWKETRKQQIKETKKGTAKFSFSYLLIYWVTMSIYPNRNPQIDWVLLLGLSFLIFRFLPHPYIHSIQKECIKQITYDENSIKFKKIPREVIAIISGRLIREQRNCIECKNMLIPAVLSVYVGNCTHF